MANLTIGISDLKVCRPPDVLVTYALGSCVGIGMIWRNGRRCALAHCLLPETEVATLDTNAARDGASGTTSPSPAVSTTK